MSRYTNETTVNVSGIIKAETGKAILIIVSQVNGIPLEKPASTWFPFSQVSSIIRNPDKDDVIRVKEWIVRKTAAFAEALDNGVSAVDPTNPQGYEELSGKVGFKGTGGAKKREQDEGLDDFPDDFPF